jgi:hypothetical protein
MDEKAVRKLEKSIGEAIIEVFCEMGLERLPPLLTGRRT